MWRCGVNTKWDLYKIYINLPSPGFQRTVTLRPIPVVCWERVKLFNKPIH
jgi:hypothetical protein